MASLGLLISGQTSAQREPVRTYVDEPIVGWHWYNEPQKQDEKETPPPATVPLTSLPPTTQMKVLQRMTEERLNTAILY
ncbi:conjugal transfer protein TraF, partial [Klebsiella pneumoniae]|uniref:conjugal transfer protein TraF n=1 Tax=Klebsiella pneumoniae TaxID=573 RepID=UPI001D0F13D9